MPAFKDENRALQELARELTLVRSHNLTFKDGEPLHTVLLFAECGLVCMTFEHARSVAFDQYFSELATKEPALKKVRLLANALKHCVTNSNTKPDAVDLAESTLHFEIDEMYPATPMKVTVTTELLGDAKEVIETAFRFWLEYAQRLDESGPT
jgi:hypothetical protein